MVIASSRWPFVICTPPGTGGIKPEIFLSYNSQIINESSSFTKSSWVGTGWNFDTGSIKQNLVDKTNYISVNSMCSMLMPIGTDLYSTLDQSFTKLVRNGNACTAFPKAGRIYSFELETKTSNIVNCRTIPVDLADTWK